MTARFEEAFAYAAHVHAAQTRKGDAGIPYVGHLLGVCSLVLEDGGDEDEAIAALLHDAPEDQGGRPVLDEIRERFGERVARIVEGCSDTLEQDKPPWAERKARYLAHLEAAEPSVLRVSIADKVYNLGSTVADLRVDGAKVWERFNARADDQLWYYGSLLDVFRRRNASARLVPEMDRLVAELIGLVNATSAGLVVIRPMRPAERESVEAIVQPWLLERRMQAHEEGRTTWLVAWLGDEPVGHVVVRWVRDENPRYDGLTNAPIIEGLGVVEERRNAGIGSALMEIAERVAVGRGSPEVALAVGVDNHGARRLYERRGYRDSGLGPRLHTWTFTGADGVERTEGETCTWMVSGPLAVAAGKGEAG